MGKVIWKIEGDAYQKLREKLITETLIVCFLVLFLGLGVLVLVYTYFIRPFHRLKQFSSEVAKGNLELPLPMNKNNFFWSVYREL